jgi:hypothetical protein
MLLTIIFIIFAALMLWLLGEGGSPLPPSTKKFLLALDERKGRRMDVRMLAQEQVA